MDKFHFHPIGITDANFYKWDNATKEHVVA
jgi:hypothetical protein